MDFPFTTFMYHGLRHSESLPQAHRFGWNNPSVTEFANQIEYLAKHYVPVSLDDVLAWFDSGTALPPRAMLLTFDDGYRSVLTHAAPILRRYRIPAVLFVIGGTLDRSYMPWFVPFNRMVNRAAPQTVTWRGQTWDTAQRQGLRNFCEHFKNELYRQPTAGQYELLKEAGAGLGLSSESVSECFAWDVDDDMRFLAGSEFAECQAQGLEIGAHSMTHSDLGITTGAALSEEIAGAKEHLVRHGLSVRSFSYPDGRFSDEAVALAQANYQITFAVGTSENQASRQALPRIGLERERQRDLWRKLQQPTRLEQWLEDRGLAVLRRVGLQPAKW